MRQHTMKLFVWPLLLQETVIVGVLMPFVVFFFRYLCPSVTKNFSQVLLLAFISINVGLVMGVAVKYRLIRPALALYDKESYTPEELQHALRSLSILPISEFSITFVRFGIAGNIIGPVCLYYLNLINYHEFLFTVNTVFMLCLLAQPLVYLISENSLARFYRRFGITGLLESNEHIFHLSLGKKTLGTMLLIAIPPLELVLSIIHLSKITNLDITQMLAGFYIIMFQTAILILLSGFLIIKNLSFSVQNMSVMFEDMAKGQGDLTKRLKISGLDEIGRLSYWFNAFMRDLEKIIGNVRETSLQLHESIEEVSSGSRDLTLATDKQADSVRQISSSIEQMHVSVSQNADIVEEGNQASQAVTKLFAQSKQVFESLIQAIQEISQDSRKIGEIVSTVNEVAFHTNLLALNASVEAARAGEHGKGFSVVAGEVRSLAQRSAQASGEIKNLIDGTVGRIHNGDIMMKKAAEALNELMDQMDGLFKMMGTISTSSTEQAVSINELNQAISMIDDTTQNNTSTVRELASTLDDLTGMATALAEDVSKFKVSDMHEDKESTAHRRNSQGRK